MTFFKSRTPVQVDKVKTVVEAVQNGAALTTALAQAQLTSKQYLALVEAQNPAQWDADIAAAKEILRAGKV